MLFFVLQVYGQCKAAIYMNRVHRVARLYKYDCVVRPGRCLSFFPFIFHNPFLFPTSLESD